MSTPFDLMDLQNKKVQFTSDCIVMQFTGLKDKNGKDVFEGDVLHVNIEPCGCSGKAGIHRGLVKFSDGYFVIKTIESCFMVTGSDSMSFSQMEIIGNAYQNPELLK
jgi:uncharacterized phage protein (TIGR01671 family)